MSPSSLNCAHRRGFTLLEILVVIALIALMASLVVTNVSVLLDGLGPPPMERLLRQAVREARYQAVLTKEPVSLRFDHERGAFLVEDGQGGALWQRESGLGGNAPRLQVTFFQLLPGEGVDRLSLEPEREEIDRVRFHPDRSSTPFAVRIDEEGERLEQRYDPFSDIRIVEADR